jgi:hypothetical protein
MYWPGCGFCLSRLRRTLAASKVLDFAVVGCCPDGRQQTGVEMENSAATSITPRVELTDRDERPAYQTPAIRVLDEKDVLSAFQVTVAAMTWWMM